MKSLLSDFEAKAGKTAYQSYTMLHGIERIQLLVPLKNVKAFEEEFSKVKDKSKQALFEVVTRHSGKVKE